jgi:hypothetical protein
MPTARHADFQVDLPADWVDRTVVVWSAPASAAEVPPNVVVAYDRPGPGEDLRAYATRQVTDLARSAQQFRLDLRRDVAFAGRPAIEVVFEWVAPPGVMRQRQLFSLLPDGRVTSVASTARAADFAAAEETFGRILASFRWSA